MLSIQYLLHKLTRHSFYSAEMKATEFIVVIFHFSNIKSGQKIIRIGHSIRDRQSVVSRGL